MPHLLIDGRPVTVAYGTTILAAAKKAGAEIPTMCFQEEHGGGSSCMVCLVRETSSNRLLPACAALAEEGMTIDTAGQTVVEARRTAIELLLSEHLGDCDAPCHRSCPAYMNIPLMLRQIAAGEWREAIATVKNDICLPAVLGRICPAPCERACRRAAHDGAVAICLLKRCVADIDLAAVAPYLPRRPKATGRHVAIVGAGPAGLAAAWHLLCLGHECTVFDDAAQPGGALRRCIAPERLPPDVLDAEISLIAHLGAEFRPGTRVGSDIGMDELRATFAAVVLATGETTPATAAVFGVEHPGKGVHVEPQTFATGQRGVFACGAAVHPTRLAVSSLAAGKQAAAAIHGFLLDGVPAHPRRRFSSQMGRLSPDETRLFLEGASPVARRAPIFGETAGFDSGEARLEAQRCLRCDCRKAESCRLRAHADRLHAKPHRYRGDEPRRFARVRQQAGVLYEPGKCIKCGLCVRITEKAGERLGLTFIGRGFDVRVGVPFGEAFSKALEVAARDCVTACPTGALAFDTPRSR